MKGKTRTCQQKKFNRIQSSFENRGRGKGVILISKMSTFLTLPKDCIWLLGFFGGRPRSALSEISL